MNYFQWFFKAGGWKKYILPFMALIAIDYGIIRGFDSILEMPSLGIFLAISFVIAVNSGIIYHSISTYKISQNTDQ